jgi:hypothetical protein
MEYLKIQTQRIILWFFQLIVNIIVCGDKYTSLNYKWCRTCQINSLRTSRTSGNKRIDDFIHEMQLKIDKYYDIVFEWIPYDQFNDIKKVGQGGFATVYSAIWKDGPLEYKKDIEKYVRCFPNKKIALKCLHNSQNITKQ